MQFSIIFFTVLISICHAQTPSNTTCPGTPVCSARGVCQSNNVCACTVGFTGDDCSIPLVDLIPGQWVDGLVGAWQWQYYSLTNPTKDINLLVETKPKAGTETQLSDCDIYVQKDTTPTASNFRKSNLEWGTTASVLVEKAETGKWFIGIFSNFLNCSYSVRASLTYCKAACLHGSCILNTTTNNGTCICDNGWTGATCEIQDSQAALELDHQYNSLHVSENTWTFYYTEIPADKTPAKISIDVQITSKPLELHDCDVYVRRGEAPSFIFWDYKDTSVSANFSINISSPKEGRWYIGVWGYKSCTLDMKIITSASVCPGNCSEHGTCEGRCNCNSAYEGDNCESKKFPLTPSEHATGYVAANSWNYFTYTPTDTSSTTIINLAQLRLASGLPGDCDLYVKRGQRPTRYDFDNLDISLSPTYNLTVPGDSRGSTIYIGIFGWAECKYDVSLMPFTAATCLSGCVNGVCTTDGICLCRSGFVGQNCDKAATQLVSGVRQNNLITGSGEWQYYQISSSSDYIVVTLKELGPRAATNGFLYLYVKEGSQPTLENFDYIDIDVNKGLHSITITPNTTISRGRNDYIVGVFGSPFVNAPLPYAVAAWETPI